MRYATPLVEARLIRRYKRFLTDVVLPDGEQVTAHLANPGKMTSCLADDAPVRLSRSPDPKRKLPWAIEQIQVGGTWIVVNTARPNFVVGEALAAGAVSELAGYPVLERERQLGDSRIDFRLTDGDRVAWVEVKNATMAEGRRGLFPDTRSERGLRHLAELVEAVRAGDRAVLLFHVGRGDVDSVAPADAVDPGFGAALRAAVEEGVEVLARRCRIDAHGLELGVALPVLL